MKSDRERLDDFTKSANIMKFTGDPVNDIPQLIERVGTFTVKFSPVANDPTCKMTVGINEFMITVDQMKAVVAKLEVPE